MSNEIMSLINQIKEACFAERLPFAIFVAEEKNQKTEYESCILTPMHLQKPLTNDKITPLVALLNDNFRMEFTSEQKPEDIEGAIFEQLRDEMDTEDPFVENN